MYKNIESLCCTSETNIICKSTIAKIQDFPAGTVAYIYIYIWHMVCVCSLVQSCLTLCSPMDCSPPGSSVHGISQVRILEWVAISYFRRSSCPRNQTHISCVSCIGRRILYLFATWEAPYTAYGAHVNQLHGLTSFFLNIKGWQTRMVKLWN